MSLPRQECDQARTLSCGLFDVSAHLRAQGCGGGANCCALARARPGGRPSDSGAAAGRRLGTPTRATQSIRAMASSGPLASGHPALAPSGWLLIELAGLGRVVVGRTGSR